MELTARMFAIVRHKIQTTSNPSDSIMTEPLQIKGTQQHLLAEQPNIPSGVMQAVLMHALQLRRRCREVFLLCDIQRHSVPEAAAILGISRTAANRRLQVARRRMNEVIEHLYGARQEPAQLTAPDRLY
jgi:DNA-directed RNA polymerase specialized sigma24 family protein